MGGVRWLPRLCQLRFTYWKPELTFLVPHLGPAGEHPPPPLAGRAASLPNSKSQITMDPPQTRRDSCPK